MVAMFAMYFRLISYKSTWHRLWISKEGAGRGGGPEKWTSQILILWLTSKNKTMKQSRTLFWQVSKILNQGDGGGEGVWDVHNLTRESNIFPNPRNVKFGGGIHYYLGSIHKYMLTFLLFNTSRKTSGVGEGT